MTFQSVPFRLKFKSNKSQKNACYVSVEYNFGYFYINYIAYVNNKRNRQKYNGCINMHRSIYECIQV